MPEDYEGNNVAHQCPYCGKYVLGSSNLYYHMDWCARQERVK